MVRPIFIFLLTMFLFGAIINHFISVHEQQEQMAPYTPSVFEMKE